jgi:hypothetical protein
VAIRDAITCHHPPGQQHLHNSFKARLYSARLNRRVITTSPNSRHGRLLAGGVLLLKSNKENVLNSNILAQVLVDYHF